MDRPRDVRGARNQGIPWPYVGSQELPRGAWAEFALRPRWRVAVEDDRVKTEFLEFLLTMTAPREPALRPHMPWGALRFNQLVGEYHWRVEALLVQIVGRLREWKCEQCLRYEGPFTHCCTIDALGWPKSCGNCLWRHHHLQQCSLTLPTTTRRRRRRQILSQIRQIPNEAPEPATASTNSNISRRRVLRDLRPLQLAMPTLGRAWDQTNAALRTNRIAWANAANGIENISMTATNNGKLNLADIDNTVRDIRSGAVQAGAVPARVGEGNPRELLSALEEMTQRVQELQELVSDVMESYTENQV